MQKILAQYQNARYYTRFGEPTDVKDIRVAIKQDLVPSATTVIKLFPKDQLNAWINEQYILAAITLPRLPDEPVDAFVERVIDDANKQRDSAAAWGSTFHDLIHAHLSREAVTYPKEMAPHFAAFAEWSDSHIKDVIATEEIAVHPSGYAGRLDLIARSTEGVTIMDFKSRSIKPGKKAATYPEQPIQLAAYARAWELKTGCSVQKMASVMIDRDNPSAPHVHYYEPEMRIWAENVFSLLLELWKLIKLGKP